MSAPYAHDITVCPKCNKGVLVPKGVPSVDPYLVLHQQSQCTVTSFPGQHPEGQGAPLVVKLPKRKKGSPVRSVAGSIGKGLLEFAKSPAFVELVKVLLKK